MQRDSRRRRRKQVGDGRQDNLEGGALAAAAAVRGDFAAMHRDERTRDRQTQAQPAEPVRAVAAGMLALREGVEGTRDYFARQGVQADLIKLYGALELAPIMHLADQIVDIVDTGNTLRANGMEPLQEIAVITSRLVVNKAAMRSRHAAIRRIIEDLTAVVGEAPIATA